MAVNSVEKYRFLKRKLKILVYEHESLSAELVKSQRRLLKVSRDNSYLLDRLLQYEQVIIDSPDDSDVTVSSDSDLEAAIPSKKRLMSSQTLGKNLKTQPTDELPAKQTDTEEAKSIENVEQDVKIKTEIPFESTDLQNEKPTIGDQVSTDT